MNKLTSGIVAISIYLGLIFLILLYYNVHEIKAKNYVEKNSNRVTVTLVNSDKTVFNKSSKHSTPTKPIRVHHSIRPQKSHTVPPKPKTLRHPIKPKKVHTPTKKEIEEKKVAKAKARRAKERLKRLERERVANIKKAKSKKEAERLAQIAKAKKRRAEAKAEAIKRAKAKKEAERLAQIAKDKKRRADAKAEAIKRAKAKKEAKRLAQIKQEKKKKEEAKARVQRIKKEKEKKRLARIKAERERKKRIKERSNSLFSSVNTSSSTKSPKAPPKERSHIRHNSSVADRIKNTHLSGRTSNRNRERGVENAYIAKVQKQLRNWNAQ
ncbi:MAG TPA: hypothetical protein ENK74_01880, partial [Nitratifractor sp.]|nr:hypothetical protein [Nitratifractor sp.]